MFHGEYVVTWDSNHIWVLDIEQGVVIGCHSNLGKICSVSVCGHEIFVLLYQTECFLIRLVLTTERVVESPCLDAVVAGSIAPGNYQPRGAISYWQETGKQSKDAISILETGAVIESGLQFTPPINLQVFFSSDVHWVRLVKGLLCLTQFISLFISLLSYLHWLELKHVQFYHRKRLLRNSRRIVKNAIYQRQSRL